MTDAHGVIPEPGTIVFQRTLPGPVERVWEHLTNPGKRGLWLATGKMELRVGGKVTLDFHHADLSSVPETVPEKYRSMENGSSFTGHITRCEPPFVLAYTWAESWGDDSEVTFELTPGNGNVLLRLTHRRLGDKPEALVSVAAGWHTHLGILADRLAGREPQPFWSAHSACETEYAERIARFR